MQEKCLRLAPGHLDDLGRSGLSNESIKRAGIYSVRPADLNKILGATLARKVLSALAFPYPFHDGFIRYKLFPPAKTRAGTIRYFQPPGSQNHLYLPPGIEAVLKDSTADLFITEGEKKALKAMQEGVWCIGTGGLWNWSDGSNEKNLIPDFEHINFDHRSTFLVPDNDWLSPDHHGERKNSRQAVYELAYRLIDKDARVYVVELPAGSEKGLDDYLCHHSVEEFKRLPKREIRKQTIEEMIQNASLDNLRDILKRLGGLPQTEQAVHINALSKKLNIAKRAIQKDLQTLFVKKEENPDIDRLLEAGANPQSRYSAQNFIDGVLSFGAILGTQRLLVRSDGEIILADGSNEDSFRFKRSTLSPNAIRRIRMGEDIDGADLLARIRILFSDHIIFKDDRISLLLAAWSIGTYMFKLFRFYGYLFFTSPVKRCGKSLALDILSLVSFNATTRMVNPSEASTFREVNDNSSTLVVDEVESLSDADREKRGEMISLLNAGFQKGAQVARVESRNKEFAIVYFDAYSPKALAGIRRIADTIEDRSFKIPMIRKAKSETIRRFNLRVLEPQIEKIRDDCYIWALRHASDVAEIYTEKFEFPGIEELDDRLRDILEPLLTIASVIDAQKGDEVAETVKDLIGLARDVSQERKGQELLSGSVSAVVNLLQDIVAEEERRFVSADDLFAKFQEDEDLTFIHSKKAMATFLGRLGVQRIRKKEGSNVIRGYAVQRGVVEELEERYT